MARRMGRLLSTLRENAPPPHLPGAPPVKPDNKKRIADLFHEAFNSTKFDPLPRTGRHHFWMCGKEYTLDLATGKWSPEDPPEAYLLLFCEEHP